MEERTRITIATYNECAQTFQDKFMDVDLYHRSYDGFCERIQGQHARILEIGCGPGNITRYLFSKRPDFSVLAIDLAPQMIDLAKVNAPQAEFRLMDCRDICTLDEQFDAILCGFCMPYLSDDECAKMISDMAGLLNPGGTIYFSTMEGDNSRSGFEKTSFSGDNQVYIYYHQSGFLQEQLEINGFGNIELLVQGYPEEDGTITNDLIYIATK